MDGRCRKLVQKVTEILNHLFSSSVNVKNPTYDDMKPGVYCVYDHWEIYCAIWG